ncbi:unnamed protein product [Gongylonema pulchrum]|uniref:Nas2_N domain-containing protein n=1 Tax=Gongylonema pulchrum TaxID=637853 RepID=A0A183E5G0_9BILA|nr:unnamed protein product [Gongylonema pulchrum]
MKPTQANNEWTEQDSRFSQCEMAAEQFGDGDEMTIDAVKKLIAQRDELDRRIAAEEMVLKNNNIDMTTSLVDAEGFPISSVDVCSVRRARNAIICAQNDRKKLTDEIEKAMLRLHEQKRQGNHQSPSNDEGRDEKPVHRTSNNPFARVGQVMAGSPASDALLCQGLKDGDHIIQFGPLHAGNFNEMQQFTTIVQNSINRMIKVTIMRDGRAKRLELVPRTWSGRGVLGCSVLPVTSAHLI